MNYEEIQLTRGLVAKVSPGDAAIRGVRWHAVKAGKLFYAARKDKDKTIYMHRLVMGLLDAPRDIFVDHINGDGLDNRRENLRQSDAKANGQNRRYASDYLGMRGVRHIGDRWEAQIGVDGKLIFLGSFLTQREAGIAFSAASRAIGRNEP